MKNRMDYQRFVMSEDVTPRSCYRRHIDNLLDANQLLYDKVQIMDRVNAQLLAEIRRLRAEVAKMPDRGRNGRYVKKYKTS